ncbi:unnamed protein product [Vitrella brassicaformis CCMP3155]|uniref:peptide chain release factor N(5)-glutamine methyltransferase n=1 Tax=Vitrella brassicaformis (strain CCMP3155) TaxID=1169540 RepID=A0A0G4EHU7_VITBC|nr:unnamed protein product [Vitrella brassicaformis CCMP3155]|eukprot:CEL95770.1 unnamed protein product [Vitrella brassicaformis CCMP3155]
MTAASERFASAGISEPDVSARCLMAHVLSSDTLNLPKRLVRTALTEEQRRLFDSLCAKRLRRMPVQYVVGRWDFHHISVKCEPPVLIPRPETEELVELILEEVRRSVRGERALHLLDVGAGTGAIGLALLKQLPTARCTAIDLSPHAVRLASANAATLSLADRYKCLQADMLTFEPPDDERYDLIVSNPPYIPTAEIPTLQPEVRDYEDSGALDGGADGMFFIRSLASRMAAFLKPHGQGGMRQVWLETDSSHPEVLQGAVAKRDGSGDFGGRVVSMQWWRDLGGHSRFVRLDMAE